MKENFLHKMSYIVGMQSFINHNLVNHNINYKLDDRAIVIVNSCNIMVCPITRYCNMEILT